MTSSLALASRVSSLKPSATVAMTERVRAARNAGRRILSLASGDPNLDTDRRIVDAAEKAMRDGDTRYAPAAGVPALREAIAEREAKRSGVATDAADILVTPGGKFALLTALMAILEPGDEVIIPAPGWVSYAPCVRMCGAEPVSLDVLDTLDIDQLEKCITPRTKAIVLNSPVNPTGRVLGEAELAGVARLACAHGLFLVWDQVYADLVHEGAFCFPRGIDGMAERTFVIDSMSKTFSMTGWRLGYLALPPGMAKTVLKFVQHSVYCVPGFVQAAGIEALRLFDEIVPANRRMFRDRQKRTSEVFDGLDGVSCPLPDATFYLFPSVRADDAAVSRRWLDEINVAVLPGSSFGAAGEGHLRLSVTCSDDDLSEALDRIRKTGLPA